MTNSAAAMRDVSHLLRPGHLKQVAEILNDRENYTGPKKLEKSPPNPTYHRD